MGELNLPEGYKKMLEGMSKDMPKPSLEQKYKEEGLKAMNALTPEQQRILLRDKEIMQEIHQIFDKYALSIPDAIRIFLEELAYCISLNKSMSWRYDMYHYIFKWLPEGTEKLAKKMDDIEKECGEQ